MEINMTNSAQKKQSYVRTSNRSKKNLLTIELNGERIRARKWKGSDKKKFINAIKQATEGDSMLLKTMDILVHNALETHKNETFTHDEYKYLLTRIRQHSLGSEMSAELVCGSCGEPIYYEYDILDVIKPLHSTLEDFENDEVHVKFGKIKNRELYLKTIENNEELDILFRIEEINGNNSFSMEELTDIIDDLSLDVIDELMQFYEENKFEINDLVEIECPSCSEKTLYEFDEIPGFFPDNWFEEIYKEMFQKMSMEELTTLKNIQNTSDSEYQENEEHQEDVERQELPDSNEVQEIQEVQEVQEIQEQNTRNTVTDEELQQFLMKEGITTMGLNPEDLTKPRNK